MSKSAFERAMGNIAREDEQWKLDEARAEQRREIIRKIRKALLVIVGAAVVGYAYTHRVELGQRIQKLTGKDSEQAETVTGNKIKGIQDAAQKRDAALDDLAGK